MILIHQPVTASRTERRRRVNYGFVASETFRQEFRPTYHTKILRFSKMREITAFWT
jgi:hypothetical protein